MTLHQEALATPHQAALATLSREATPMPDQENPATRRQEALTELIRAQRDSRGFAHKLDISDVMRSLARSLPDGSHDMNQAVPVGDDCAAIPDGNGGYLLFAIEGLVEDFIEAMPWFAGYCSVMVNASDIYAMGGRPVAVVDALWSPGAQSSAPMLAGMAQASQRYGIPIVGGHSNHRSQRPQLAVAILGRAQRLLTSFDARPGDCLLMATDLRGDFEEPFPYWNASTRAPAGRLRADLEILPGLAEQGLCDAAKDISMAGILGTALMLVECSRVGARIDLDALPIPPDVPMNRWLTAFPSYGFLLSVRPQHMRAVMQRFAARDIACAAIGDITDTTDLQLHWGDAHGMLWDWAEQPFITGGVSRESPVEMILEASIDVA